jgi:hypothetical protein
MAVNRHRKLARMTENSRAGPITRRSEYCSKAALSLPAKFLKSYRGLWLEACVSVLGELRLHSPGALNPSAVWV